MPAAPEISTATAGRSFCKIWEKFFYLIAAVLFALIYWASETYGGLTLARADCAAFGLIGVAMLAYAWRLSVHARPGTAWLPVEARILDSEVVSERDSMPYPRITYRYEVQGLAYTSSNVALVKVNYALAEARAIVERYPAGARVLAYVDPADPRTAVLEPGIQGNTRQYAIPAVVGAMFTVFGAAAWYLIPLLATSR